MNKGLRALPASIILLTAFIVQACEEDTRFTIEQDQQIIFHYSYQNDAFSPQYYGWCIDKDGIIRKLTESLHWDDEIDNIVNVGSAFFWYDRDSIDLLYGMSTGSVLGKIRNAELEDKISLIEDITYEDYSIPINQMADAGSVVYGFLSYDKGTDQYRRIVLEITGDWYSTLEDDAAVELVEWLRKIQKDIGYPDYFK